MGPGPPGGEPLDTAAPVEEEAVAKALWPEGAMREDSCKEARATAGAEGNVLGSKVDAFEEAVAKALRPPMGATCEERAPRDEMAEWLISNPMTLNTATFLDLRGKTVGQEGVRVLADVLKQNRTLRRLYLDHNNMAPEDCKQLAKALLDNSTLKELWFDDSTLPRSQPQPLPHQPQDLPEHLAFQRSVTEASTAATLRANWLGDSVLGSQLGSNASTWMFRGVSPTPLSSRRARADTSVSNLTDSVVATTPQAFAPFAPSSVRKSVALASPFLSPEFGTRAISSPRPVRSVLRAVALPPASAQAVASASPRGRSPTLVRGGAALAAGATGAPAAVSVLSGAAGAVPRAGPPTQALRLRPSGATARPFNMPQGRQSTPAPQEPAEADDDGIPNEEPPPRLRFGGVAKPAMVRPPRAEPPSQTPLCSPRSASPMLRKSALAFRQASVLPRGVAPPAHMRATIGTPRCKAMLAGPMSPRLARSAVHLKSPRAGALPAAAAAVATRGPPIAPTFRGRSPLQGRPTMLGPGDAGAEVRYMAAALGSRTSETSVTPPSLVRQLTTSTCTPSRGSAIPGQPVVQVLADHNAALCLPPQFFATARYATPIPTTGTPSTRASATSLTAWTPHNHTPPPTLVGPRHALTLDCASPSSKARPWSFASVSTEELTPVSWPASPLAHGPIAPRALVMREPEFGL